MNPTQSKAHRLLLTTTACVREAEKQSKAAQREAGPLLRSYRKWDGVYMKQVADILGVSIFRVTTIERGINLTPQLFQRYIDAVDAIALNRNTHVRYSARP